MFGSDDHGWPAPAKPYATVTLRLGRGGNAASMGNLSAATRIGDNLFLAADEGAALIRLTQDGTDWSGAEMFDLGDLLPLADPSEEADLEGLAAEDDWLWVLGSHARTRAKPEKAEGECIDLEALADLKDTRPRCLIARIPLVQSKDGMRPAKKVGKRRAAMLSQGKHGNAVSKALKHDPLIGPFTRIPAKEGGVDIEGISVCDNRVALGMRGPVIATHALLLEFTVRAKSGGKLALSERPVKRLLALEGLGIRDLKRCGRDLLILAGPTAGLSGPCALYRWRGWADDPPQNETEVRLHRPDRIVELPFGRGQDHPEGLALWPGDPPRHVLVIYDSPSKQRLKKGESLTADLFTLPE